MPKRQKQNSDHAHKHNTPTIDNEVISQQLKALLTPAIFAQEKYYKQLGLRDRIINLSFMLSAVLTLLWRQVPGVQELTRLLAREDVLWCRATELSLPFDRISLEMIYRGLYHFSVAHDKGNADDPIKYFAAKENQDLGVVKALRKPVPKLNLSPFFVPT